MVVCVTHGHRPCRLVGEEFPLSLPTSLSSISLPSRQNEILLTLGSELALLLVARGESEMLTVLLFVDPDLTLYMEEAGMFVMSGRRLPEMLFRISICLKAMSRDFLESVLPKPELSREENFPAVWADRWSSSFGGTSFLMFTTLSTILVPITTGLTLSVLLECALRTEGMVELLPLGFPTDDLPLEGEHDCLLGLPLVPASTEDDRALEAPGLPREAEAGLSGTDVLKFGGASSEKPGISDGFQGLDFTVGEVPRDGATLFKAVGLDFDTKED